MSEYQKASGARRKDPQYAFLTEKYGDPRSIAEKIMNALPEAREKYSAYFDCKGLNAAVLFGANAVSAVTLAALGARSAVFVSSESEKKYAAAVSKAAGVKIVCKVCDFQVGGLEEYEGSFGALLFQLSETERFYDISEFIGICRRLLARGGVLLFGSFDRPDENMLYTGRLGARKHTLTDAVYAVNTGGFRVKSFDERRDELIVSAERIDQ